MKKSLTENYIFVQCITLHKLYRLESLMPNILEVKVWRKKVRIEDSAPDFFLKN